MEPIESYWKRLVSVCIDRGLSLRPLGKVGRQAMWMVHNVPRKIPCSKLLIVAGTHGEEIAGPRGVLKFLEETSDDILQRAFLSIIPVVAPTVFGKRRQRTIRSNCGFVPGIPDKRSVEAGVLMRHMPMLVRAAADGLLNLHETIDAKEHFFLYLMGENWAAARDLLHIGSQYFKITPDGESIKEPRSPRAMVWGGIAHNVRDGSLDDRLYIEGVPICVTSETPGKKKLSLRIEANRALIEGFIKIRG